MKASCQEQGTARRPHSERENEKAVPSGAGGKEQKQGLALPQLNHTHKNPIYCGANSKG